MYAYAESIDRINLDLSLKQCTFGFAIDVHATVSAGEFASERAETEA